MDLAPEAAQLLALVGRETVIPPPGVSVGLAQPEADGFMGTAQLLGQLGGGPPAFAHQPDGLGAELGRVRRMGSRHVDSFLRGHYPQRSGVHESGATSFSIEELLPVIETGL